MTDQLSGAPDAAVSAASFDDETPSRIGRWVLNRAGIVNVWQDDRAEFRFAGGRALLRREERCRQVQGSRSAAPVPAGR